MNTKALRQKVLDLAIHGKLVPQNPNDESATVLLEKIRAEKAEKIKKGELKADKKDSFIFTKECEFDEDKLGKCSSGTRHKRHYEQFADGTVKDIEDEIPFEVPDGWAWCRLGEISSELGDGIHGTPEYDVNGDYYFVNGNNLCNGKIIIKDDTKRVSQIEYNKYKKNLNQNTILVSINGTLGNIAFYNKENIILGKSACYFNLFEKQFKDFMFFLLSSEYFKKYASENATGSTIKNVSLKTMRDFLVPLPTLNEQKKIVSAIKTIFNQITIIENDKTDLQEIIKQTKSKILDLAIHGKLVPQDPNDEPAEELLKRIATSDNRPYEKIEEGDIPFEIPPSWKWTTIKNIVNYIGDGDWIESKDQSDKGIRLIQTGNIGFGTFKDKEGKYHYISENTFSSLGCNEIFEGDILISRLPEPVGRACILPKVPERMITAVDCTIIRLNEELFQKELFVYYTISNKYLELIKENCTGTTRLRISRSNLEKIFIPIPPLNEQKRILNRIKKLFETLDEIVLNLV